MSAKLILLCKEGDAREAYLKEAKAIGVEVDVAVLVRVDVLVEVGVDVGVFVTV